MEEINLEKRFKCHICLKTFKDNHGLVKHERIHTREKPFQCDICLKTFTQKSTLDVHIRNLLNVMFVE